MKKLAAVLTLLLCCSCAANAQTTRSGQEPSKPEPSRPETTRPDTTSYMIRVHVSAAHVVSECSGSNSKSAPGIDCGLFLHLNVVIAGVKYELRGKGLMGDKVVLLTPGNYSAKVISEFHNAAGVLGVKYELLLSDNSTWQGEVSGVSE